MKLPDEMRIVYKYLSLYFCLFILGIFCNQVQAQSPSDTTQTEKRITLLLPDGKILPMDKFDSLEKVWGKGRVMFRHNQEDDVKGIMHLVQVTDDMKQRQDAQDEKNLRILNEMLNKSAPDFELADLNGKHWSLKTLKGKIVVLNFWFTSCLPCIKEMPELNKLVRDYAGKEIVFLALTFDNDDQVNLFLKKHTFTYILLPGSNEVDQQYHISSWPTNMVIDQKGVVKLIMQSSPKIREELVAAIDSLL